jgi:hypothetical protein
MYVAKKYAQREKSLKNSGRKAWVLLLVLLAGVLIGGVVWLLLLKILPPDMANSDLVIGSKTGPWTLDLYLVELTFGIQLHINPGSVAGLIAALAFYFWRR